VMRSDAPFRAGGEDAGGVESSNVLTIHDAVHDGAPYLVSELLEEERCARR